jgi:ribosome-binding factor A
LNPAQIKKLRTEASLKTLIPEALSQLGDERLHELSVLEVVCSRGRSDAKVYLDPTFCEKNEEGAYLKQLRKARSSIELHIKNDQGWYRCPKLVFEFDHQLEHNNKMEDLFAQVRKEIGSDEDSDNEEEEK